MYYDEKSESLIMVIIEAIDKDFRNISIVLKYDYKNNPTY